MRKVFFMAQEENHLQSILAEILAENRQLLGKKDELIERLSKKVGAEDQRDYKSLRIALKEYDLGELVLLADNGTPEEKAAVEAEALKRLGHMQESRARLVMEILVGAMGWHKDSESEIEYHAEIQGLAEEAQAVQEMPQEQQVDGQQEKTWDCVCGRKNNKKKFCRECGRARAEGEVKGGGAAFETWACSQCGHAGNKAKFCVACGSPRDMSATANPAVSLVKFADQMADSELEQNDMSTETAEAVLAKGNAHLSQTHVQADLEQTQVMPFAVTQQVREDTDQVSVQRGEQMASINPSATPPVQQSPVMQAQTIQSTSGRNGTQTAIIAVIVLLVCVLGFMGFKEFSAGSGTKSSSGYHSLAKNADNAKSNEKSQLVVKSDLSLGGMDLDETMQDMYDKLGKESYTKSDDGKTYYYYKDSVRVGFTDGKVTSLVSDGTNSTTKRGIHEGSTLQEVLNAYGDSATKFNYDNLELYEYSARSLAGRDGILRFAINAQGKVEYISVRIPQEAKIDTQAVGNAAKEAVASYHKYITNRDYKAAYNLLTPDMQNTMGLFENWTQGFRNTIESRVTDLQVANVQADSAEVSFVLVARDRRPGGGYEENRFRSTATVVKTDSGWKIAAVNNKKI